MNPKVEVHKGQINVRIVKYHGGNFQLEVDTVDATGSHHRLLEAPLSAVQFAELVGESTNGVVLDAEVTYSDLAWAETGNERVQVTGIGYHEMHLVKTEAQLAADERNATEKEGRRWYVDSYSLKEWNYHRYDSQSNTYEVLLRWWRQAS